MKSNTSANDPHGAAGHPSRAGRGEPRALTVLPVVGHSGVARHCWEIIQSPDNDLHGDCEECYAHFVQKDCWTLWALRKAGHKPCCQKKDDCATCPVLLTQVGPKEDETVRIHARPALKEPTPTMMRTGSAKQVCGYLEAGDVSVPLESERYISAVSRAIQTRSSAFRCRLRGVHLDVGYVTDMCVSRHVQDCVFLEEMHPEVTVQGSALKSPLEKMPQDGVESRTSDVESRK